MWSGSDGRSDLGTQYGFSHSESSVKVMFSTNLGEDVAAVVVQVSGESAWPRTYSFL
jgi:hypothetical protein